MANQTKAKYVRQALSVVGLGLGAATILLRPFSKEHKHWNGGHCSECRQPWIFFGTSPKTLERLYTCQCERMICVRQADKERWINGRPPGPDPKTLKRQ